jgi:hypothetical protein
MTMAMHVAGVGGAICISHVYDSKRLSQDKDLRQCEINYAELCGRVSQSMDTPVPPDNHPFDTRKQMEVFWAKKQKIDNYRKEWFHPSKYHPFDLVRAVRDVFRS